MTRPFWPGWTAEVVYLGRLDGGKPNDDWWGIGLSSPCGDSCVVLDIGRSRARMARRLISRYEAQEWVIHPLYAV